MNLSILKPPLAAAPLKTFVVKLRSGQRIEVLAANYVLDTTGWWLFTTLPMSELNKFLMSGRACETVFQIKAGFVHSVEEKGCVSAILRKPRAKPKAKVKAKSKSKAKVKPRAKKAAK